METPQTFTAGLYDWVTKKRIETVTLTKMEGKKKSAICLEWMKEKYGGKCYIETWQHPKDTAKEIKAIFSEDVDWFLMFVCKKAMVKQVGLSML